MTKLSNFTCVVFNCLSPVYSYVYNNMANKLRVAVYMYVDASVNKVKTLKLHRHTVSQLHLICRLAYCSNGACVGVVNSMHA